MRYLLFLVALMSIMSCKQDESLTEEEKQMIADSIKGTLYNYYADIKVEGLRAEFKYLDSSKDFYWVPPGYSSAISYDSVSAVLTRNADMFKSIDNSFSSLSVHPLSHKLATYTARINSAMTDTAGKISAYTLVETGVIIKREDGWKLLSGQTTMLAD